MPATMSGARSFAAGADADVAVAEDQYPPATRTRHLTRLRRSLLRMTGGDANKSRGPGL
jgi:hypothetical protein